MKRNRMLIVSTAAMLALMGPVGFFAPAWPRTVSAGAVLALAGIYGCSLYFLVGRKLATSSEKCQAITCGALAGLGTGMVLAGAWILLGVSVSIQIPSPFVIRAFGDEILGFFLGLVAYANVRRARGPVIGNLAFYGYVMGLGTALLAMSPMRHTPSSTFLYQGIVAVLLTQLAGSRVWHWLTRRVAGTLPLVTSLARQLTAFGKTVSIKLAILGSATMGAGSLWAESVGALGWSRWLMVTAITVYVAAVIIWLVVWRRKKTLADLMKLEVALGVVPALFYVIHGAIAAAAALGGPPLLIDQVTPTKIYAGFYGTDPLTVVLDDVAFSNDAVGRLLFTLAGQKNTPVIVKRIFLEVVDTRAMVRHEFPKPSSMGMGSFSNASLRLTAALSPSKQRYELYDLARGDQEPLTLRDGGAVGTIGVFLTSPPGHQYRVRVRFEWYVPGQTAAPIQYVSTDTWVAFPRTKTFAELIGTLPEEPDVRLETSSLADVVGAVEPLIHRGGHVWALIRGESDLEISPAFGDWLSGTLLYNRERFTLRLAAADPALEPYVWLGSGGVLVKRGVPDEDWEEFDRARWPGIQPPQKIDYLFDRKVSDAYSARFNIAWQTASDVVILDVANEALVLPSTVVRLPRVASWASPIPKLDLQWVIGEAVGTSAAAQDSGVRVISGGSHVTIDGSGGKTFNRGVEVGQVIHVTSESRSYDVTTLRIMRDRRVVVVAVRPK